MDLANFSAFSARDAVILGIGVAAVYLLIALLRLSQIRRPGKRQANRLSPSLAAEAREPGAPASLPEDPWGEPVEPKPFASPEATYVDNVDSSTPGVPLFEFQLFRNQIEAEMLQLRQELAALHEALAQLSVARRISPQYNEAMQLAQRGASAQMIADQCAISLGEAELVAALGRDQQSYQESREYPERQEYQEHQEYPNHGERYEPRH